MQNGAVVAFVPSITTNDDSGNDKDVPDFSVIGKTGFAIYSQKLFTGENSFNIVRNVMEEDGFEPDLEDDEDDVAKSEMVSSYVKSKKATGYCSIV